jgi:hypothetical protein
VTPLAGTRKRNSNRRLRGVSRKARFIGLIVICFAVAREWSLSGDRFTRKSECSAGKFHDRVTITTIKPCHMVYTQ